MDRHVHKLVQVICSSTKTKAKGLEVELSKLRKDLIAAMDESNTAKEKAKGLSDDLRAKR